MSFPGQPLAQPPTKRVRQFYVDFPEDQRIITADYSSTRDGRIAFYLDRPAGTPDFLVASYRSADIVSFQEVD